VRPQDIFFLRHVLCPLKKKKIKFPTNLQMSLRKSQTHHVLSGEKCRPTRQREPLRAAASALMLCTFRQALAVSSSEGPCRRRFALPMHFCVSRPVRGCLWCVVPSTVWREGCVQRHTCCSTWPAAGSRNSLCAQALVAPISNEYFRCLSTAVYCGAARLHFLLVWMCTSPRARSVESIR